jgi:2-polyprenyl-3-methyl-5-hydroxy-6-metoxy-1,4-benzoquinol methylase
MSMSTAESKYHSVEIRARTSRGTSSGPIYEMVARTLTGRHPGGGTLLDVGCGTGNLRAYVSGICSRYVGTDTVSYEGFPADAEFCKFDFDQGRLPLTDGFADVVTAVETIEHLENPRAFVRELVRLARPGGWIVLTTPNQLSLLSKMTLVLKNEFNAFQRNNYPAHLTALLEVDLRRIAAECGLTEVTIGYSLRGRIPGTSWFCPKWLSRLMPRTFSDNFLMAGRKPMEP